MYRVAFVSCLLAVQLLLSSSSATYQVGRIVDATTSAPLQDAVVTLGDQIVRTDAEGRFSILGTDGLLQMRAHGHQRASFPVEQLQGAGRTLSLEPFAPKALYLSFYGIGSRTLRSAALALVETTAVNALVIDVKGDRGQIAYPSRIPLAVAVGADRITTIPDLRALTTQLREKGVYSIARIVVFKDDVLARARPDLAVTTHAGYIWRDREQLAWTDPFDGEVWSYNVAIAEETAQAGFDEIQFDYVRFPDAAGLVYSKSSTESSRISAIEAFLDLARERLAPFNVFIAADVFGYVLWNTGDTLIGQRLESLLEHVDYLSPMLYPSSFQYGIPGFRNPVQVPHEIVSRSLERARQRTGAPAIRFRPWLQAFQDYAFDRRPFGAAQIQEQIGAAEKFGTNGWMLWNPHNLYTAAGLAREASGPSQPGVLDE